MMNKNSSKYINELIILSDNEDCERNAKKDDDDDNDSIIVLDDDDEDFNFVKKTPITAVKRTINYATPTRSSFSQSIQINKLLNSTCISSSSSSSFGLNSNNNKNNNNEKRITNCVKSSFEISKTFSNHRHNHLIGDDDDDIIDITHEVEQQITSKPLTQQQQQVFKEKHLNNNSNNQILNNTTKHILNNQNYNKKIPQQNSQTLLSQSSMQYDPREPSSTTTIGVNGLHKDTKKARIEKQNEQEQVENRMQQQITAIQKECVNKILGKKQLQRRTIASVIPKDTNSTTPSIITNNKNEQQSLKNSKLTNIVNINKRGMKTETCVKRDLNTQSTSSSSSSNDRISGSSESLSTNDNKKQATVDLNTKVIVTRRTIANKEKQEPIDTTVINKLINRDNENEPIDLNKICNKLSILNSNVPVELKPIQKVNDDLNILKTLSTSKMQSENAPLLKQNAISQTTMLTTPKTQYELSIGEYLLLNYCKTNMLNRYKCDECTFDELIDRISNASKGDLYVNSSIHLNLDNIIDTYIHNSNDLFHSNQIHNLLVGILPIINHLDTHKMLDLFIKYNFICENKYFNNDNNKNNDYCLLYENYLQLIESTNVRIDLSLTEFNNTKWQSFTNTLTQLLDKLNQSVNSELFYSDTLRLKCFYELFVKHAVYLYLLKRNKLKLKYNWLQIQQEFQINEFKILFDKHLQTFESLFSKLLNENDHQQDSDEKSSEERHQIIDNYLIETLNIIQRMIIFIIIYQNTNNDALKTCLDQFVDKLVRIYLQLNKDSKRYLFINLISNIILINECKFKVCEKLLLNGRYWLNSMNGLVNNNDIIIHTVENMLNDKNGSTKHKKGTTATASIKLKLEYLNLLFAYLTCYYELKEDDKDTNNPLLKQYINSSQNSKKSTNNDLLINSLRQIINNYLSSNHANNNILLNNIVNKINLLVN